MAQTIQLDQDGDWLIVDNDIVLTRGAEATRSLILGRLPVQRGEWGFNVLFGVDWDTINQKTADDSLRLALVVGELANVPTVQAPTTRDFEAPTLDPVTREITFYGIARSNNGETVDVAISAGVST